MSYWAYFWIALFFIGIILFAALTILVAIGGFFNIRSLFKDLSEPGRISEDDSEEN